MVAAQQEQAGWRDRLLGFYEGMLRDGQVLPASSSLDEAPEHPPISANIYTDVLTGLQPLHPTRKTSSD